MCKKVHIIIKLLPEASEVSTMQIEERIRGEAKIPWCNEIEHVSVVDSEAAYTELKKQGVSSNVAQNIIDLYTE